MAVVHGAFVLVLVGGAIVVVRNPRAWRLHVPTIVAMTAVSSIGDLCQMTVLEARFRARAGWASHESGFHLALPDRAVAPVRHHSARSDSGSSPRGSSLT